MPKDIDQQITSLIALAGDAAKRAAKCEKVNDPRAAKHRDIEAKARQRITELSRALLNQTVRVAPEGLHQPSINKPRFERKTVRTFKRWAD
jgi:hypothetical protein